MGTQRHVPSASGAALGLPAATADLHCHTRRSDGMLEPVDLVAAAYAAGVRLLAIADHDNLAAYRELTAHGAQPLPDGLELVPAVEINSISRDRSLDLPEGELHIVGIGVDPYDEAFEAAIADQRNGRRHRFAASVVRLREAGYPVDAFLPPDVMESDDALGRPTLARALVAAGHAFNVQDAFDRLVGAGCPGYVPRVGLDPAGAIRAIRAAGGLASLAHFPQAAERMDLVRGLIAAGLNGLETHHRSFDADTRARMHSVAVSLGLTETGGTDFHGDTGPYSESHAALAMPADLVEGVRRELVGRPRANGHAGTTITAP